MVPPDDPSARPDAHEHEHEPGDEAKEPASTPAAPDRSDDDPPLSELAAAATDRPRAKTLGDVAARLPPAPKIPPPPAIAAGTRGRVKTGLAFEFDLGDAAGPVSLSKLTAGPAVLARKPGEPDEPDDDAPTIAREEAGAADALAQEANRAAHAATLLGVDATSSGDATASEHVSEASAERSGPTRGDAESSGRSGAPRLPVPGMLGKRAAPEFRDARRAPKAPMGPGIVPPGGVMPPGAVEAVREPQDTNLLIDVVAAELMEPPSEDELPVVAPAAAREAAAASTAGASMRASGNEDSAPSRRWMIAAAAALLLGVAVWGMSRDSDPAPDDSARAVAKANPGEAAMVAKTEPPRPADPPRERIALAQDDGAAKAVDEAAAEDAAAEDAEAEDTAAEEAAADVDEAVATGGEEPTEDMVLDGADAEAAPPPPQPVAEATPASTSSKASTSRRRGSSKSSSKTSSKTSSSKPATADASGPATSSKPGGDDAKSLLAQAKSALSAGNGSKAYTLASKSHKLKYSTDAIEVMTIASCLKKDEARAKSLFKQVPLFRRSAVKSKCKSSGVKVGI